MYNNNNNNNNNQHFEYSDVRFNLILACVDGRIAYLGIWLPIDYVRTVWYVFVFHFFLLIFNV